MTAASLILRAKRIGVRSFRENLSRFIRKNDPLVITENGDPTSVLLPYTDILELVDVLDELEDKVTLKLIAEGRKAIKSGARGVSFEK